MHFIVSLVLRENLQMLYFMCHKSYEFSETFCKYYEWFCEQIAR